MSATSLLALVARCRSLCRPRSQAADCELLARFAQQRDAAAFEELLERYAALVWGVCRRIAPTESDGEDAFQATFLALVRQAGRLDDRQPLGGWLHTVAVRIARKAATHARKQTPWTTIPEPATARDIAEEIGSRELLRLVDEEIERLPANLRKPLILCCLEGRTRDEAAETLDCSVATVKSRLERGRNLLRRRLQRRGVELPAAFLVLGLTGEGIRAALWAKTMQSALYTPAPAIAALAEAGVSSLTVGKCKLLLVALLLVSSTAGAIGSLRTRTKPETPPAAEPKKPEAPQVRTDRHGDPLPDGAIARLGTVRWRHGFFVHALAYSPNGERIAAVGAGRAITLWDAATGKEIHRFPNLTDQPDSLAFSPDSKILATAGRPCRLWDVATGKEVRQLGSGRVAFSPDGKLLATLGTGGPKGDNILRLWDPTTGEEKRRIECGSALRCELAFSPDGKRIAASDMNGIIHLCDPNTGKEQCQLKGHSKGVYRIVFSPNARYLASAGDDEETIRVWDPSIGRQVRTIGEKLGGYGGRPLAFSPDGALLASGHAGGIIRLWDVATGEEKRHWRAGATIVRALAFSPDGKTLASGAVWEGIRLWDPATGQERHPSQEHLGVVEFASFSPDGTSLASISRERRLVWWDLAKQKPRRQFTWEAPGISKTALSPDGNTLAVGRCSDAEPCRLELWDLRAGKLCRPLGEPQRRFWSVAFSPDGRLVATKGSDQTIHIWNAQDGVEVRRITDTNTNNMVSLGFSPDGKILACGLREAASGQPMLRLLDVSRGKEVHIFHSKISGIPPAAFSPDGKVLATASGPSEEKTHVGLFDITTGKELCRHEGHRLGIAAFAPDGKLVVSGGIDGKDSYSIHIWEAATGRLIRRFTGHHSCVASAAFARDGLTVASGGGDSTILLWDITGRRADSHWHVKPLTAREAEACWTALAKEDAAKAYDAVWKLVAAPEQAVPFLRKKLSPVSHPDARAVARLIAELDSDDFLVRQKAAEELTKLGDVIAPSLRQTLENKPSLEVRRRVQQLLEQTYDWTPERLRVHRAMQVLEHVGTPSAREVLQTLADGAPAARRTEEAKAALRRLRQR